MKLNCLPYCFTLQQVFESKSSQWSLCSTLSKHFTRSVEYLGYLLATELLLLTKELQKKQCTCFLGLVQRALIRIESVTNHGKTSSVAYILLHRAYNFISNKPKRMSNENNLVPRAFPSKNGWGGKRPWHRLVTCLLVHSKILGVIN